MNSNTDFLKECKEWLEPKNFSLSFYSPDRSCTFSNNAVSVECFIKDDTKEKRCKITAGPYKMFMVLVTGELQFKHPDIDKFIEVATRYDKLLNTYNPW